ncbi:MAG: zinc ribbon domain-containing protein [Bacillota bacterium]|nr:zinc ribbon domain-containing protein [Bacillota bacterium]
MICSKCGAILPEDATFCGECGAKIIRPEASPAAVAKAKKEAKRYKIISVVLAGLCVVMAIGWAVTFNDPYKNIDNYEEEAADIQRAGVELSGTYVVGEDPELPEGRYNIYPPDNESYMSVEIYLTKEDAKKQYDKDFNSLAEDELYSLTRGYRLNAGEIVVIDYDSAYFELVSETPSEESSEPSEETSDETQAETE